MHEFSTEWAVVWLSPLPLIWQVLLTVLVATLCGRLLWQAYQAKAPYWLMILRVVITIMLLALLAQPALEKRAVKHVRDSVAVVIDNSLSMSLPSQNNLSRYQRLLNAIDDPHVSWQRLAQEHQIIWFDLQGTLSEKPKVTDQAPTQESTDLLAALENVLQNNPRHDLAGIILLSDGADNAELVDTTHNALPATAKQRLMQLGVPVHTIDVAGKSQLTDMGIDNVLHDDFAFVQNSIEIVATLHSQGFESQTLPLTLKRDNDIIATQIVELPKNGTATTTFKIKPDKIGEFIYSVTLPQIDGDMIASNNMVRFVMNITRDKIRVLQIAGRPSWDERFLRQYLKSNPNVDLISFFILRTPSNEAHIKDAELSLIPFPVHQLFTQELSSFDVIIWQNFDYQPYNMAQYLPNIVNAIKGGLGFAILGGEHSFAEADHHSPLAEIIPIRMGQGSFVPGPVSLQLTPAGHYHPLTHIEADSPTSMALGQRWQQLPALQTFNKSRGLQPQATALLVNTQHASDDSLALPLLAVMEAGEGRSLAVMSDSLWRWHFAAPQQNGDNTGAYNRFWSGALRWLVKDPEHARVRVMPSKRTFATHEPIDITVSVLDKAYEPVPFANVVTQLTLDGNSQQPQLTWVTGDTGMVQHRYEQLPEGAYHLKATAYAKNQLVGSGSTVFLVANHPQEWANPLPRPDILQAIAATTKGQYASVDEDFLAHLPMRDLKLTQLQQLKILEIWDNGWVLALILSLLVVEWFWRRQHGLA